MNKSHTILKSILISTLAFSLANAADEDEDMIITSKPHRLPRLMTLQTSEVLESYGVGFAGSGNIHNIAKGSRDALKGAIYLGLGDVAELGYDMETVRLSGTNPDKRMKGHVKIQAMEEKKYTPAFAVTYGANISNDIEIGSTVPFAVERQSWLLGLSKTMQLGNYSLSVHPALNINMDILKSVQGVKVAKERTSTFVGGQLGATWQSKENTMFMFESRVVSVLDTAVNADAQLNYQYGFENNLGVRFYVRNWLFLDAGILSIYDSGEETWNTGIHANVTGIIPLKSVSSRLFGGK